MGLLCALCRWIYRHSSPRCLELSVFGGNDNSLCLCHHTKLSCMFWLNPTSLSLNLRPHLFFFSLIHMYRPVSFLNNLKIPTFQILNVSMTEVFPTPNDWGRGLDAINCSSIERTLTTIPKRWISSTTSPSYPPTSSDHTQRQPTSSSSSPPHSSPSSHSPLSSSSSATSTSQASGSTITSAFSSREALAKMTRRNVSMW